MRAEPNSTSASTPSRSCSARRGSARKLPWFAAAEVTPVQRTSSCLRPARAPPAGGERPLGWLAEKHMAGANREPGFRWAQRGRLEQRDEQGWLGYLLIYGLEPHEALERYLARPARERFWRELEPLGAVQRAERFYGTVDLRLEAASSS